MDNSTLDYRNRFNTSKRKLPIFFRTFFKEGQEIIVEVAYYWSGGLPKKYRDEPHLVKYLDEYAIICEHKHYPESILILDWKSIYGGDFKLDKEIFKKIEEMAKNKKDEK